MNDILNVATNAITSFWVLLIVVMVLVSAFVYIFESTFAKWNEEGKQREIEDEAQRRFKKECRDAEIETRLEELRRRGCTDESK